MGQIAGGGLDPLDEALATGVGLSLLAAELGLARPLLPGDALDQRAYDQEEELRRRSGPYRHGW